MKKISTDGDTTAPSADETMSALRGLGGDPAAVTGRPASPFFAYYKLTVTDSAGATNTAVVKLVIHDQPANPRVATLVPSVTNANKARGSAISEEVVPPKSGKYVIAPGSTILVTATASDADQDDGDDATSTDIPTVTWEGAQATIPGALTANFQAPATAEEGDEFTVTATATDVTGRTGTKSVVLVVATNTAPEAVAPGTDDPAPSPLSRITVNDGPDGGDINPATQKGTGVVKLRGIGFDADGDPLIHNWSELTFPTYDDDSDAETPEVLDTDATRVPGTSGMPGAIKLPRKAVLTIDNAFSDNASFEVPEVGARHTVDANGNLVIPIAYTVIDKWGVKDTDIVIITITQGDDIPVANAGPNQQVTSGSFVRLNGAASSDSDPGDRISHAWTYVGIVTDPATENRPLITAAERGSGFVEGKWFPYDGIVRVYVEDGDDADTDSDIEEMAVFSDHSIGTPDAEGVYALNSDVGGPAGVGADGEAGTADDIIQVEPGVLTAAADDDATTPQNETQGDAPRGSYHPTAGGALNNAGSPFPYFDAPRLGGFNSIKLQFSLVVTDGQATGTQQDPVTADDQMSVNRAVVTITITDGYYSGNVTSPDFCTNMSLGGPTTYALDSDGDGVADTCSLRDTRRGTVARQNALETLAALNSDAYKDALHGKADGSTRGTCATAPKTLGDSDAALAADSCGPASAGKRSVSAPPAPVDPASADEFFSGVITGPSFCANASLGGPTTYAFDSDGDGVADICSLPFTRREAVARQNALESFANHAQYNAALAAACTALGSTTFEGDSAADLANDACTSKPKPVTGDPLP